MKPVALLLFVLLAAPHATADDDPEKAADPKAEKPKPKKAGDIEIGEPGVPIADRAVAASEVAKFQSAMKEAKRKKDEKRRLELMVKLGEKDHAKIYKIATKLAKDKEFRVATAAVVCIARQKSSAKKAGKFLQKLLDREKRTNVRCAAIIGMGVLGYTKAYDDVRRLYKKDTRELRKASARYFGYTNVYLAGVFVAMAVDRLVL